MLNIHNNGKPLCKIEGGKLSNRIVFVDAEAIENGIDNNFGELCLDNEAKFQHIPDVNTERSVLYITGPSGSGKSTYTAKYIKQYQKAFKKKNSVYIFSALKDDATLDILNPKRIRIDQDLVDDPIDVGELADSLCIFDDVDVIDNKKIREAVYSILNQVLEVGRHHRISCIITNHLPTAGKDTRRVLNECHSVTIFPHSGSKRGLNYLCMEYLGLDKSDIVRMKKSKSRWATIFKNYPNVIMTERCIWSLADQD